MRPFKQFLLVLALCPAMLHGQTTLKVMAYNLLNFPEPNPAGKQDTLAKILAWHPVDLLICEEVRTLAGALLVLNGSLNVDGEDRFSMAAWEPMHSAPGSYALQQTLYYDHNKFTLHDQGYLLTYVRDINVYTLYVNDDLLPLTQDTTFITVYAVHLKAGNNSSDANERDAMAQVIVDHLADLPSGRHVIVAGDMNVYSGFEDAFQTLIDNGNPIVLADPRNTIGGWRNSAFYAAAHTQSTRINTIFGDGSGGGLDDRFDIALLSAGLMDPANALHYATGSYRPLGNSGDCFNMNVTNCNTTITPYPILRSMYYMSDHLPLVLDLEFDGSVGLPSRSAADQAAIDLVPLPDGSWEAIIRGLPPAIGSLQVIDAIGHVVYSATVSTPTDPTRILLPVMSSGLFIARFTTNGTSLARTGIATFRHGYHR